MIRRRRPSQSAAPPGTTPLSPLDDEDLLTEILIRLPPLPSSLPRASLVCQRWRRLITDRVFLRRFRAHQHRKPPLLGYFLKNWETVFFTPTLDPPDRIPKARFVSPRIRDDWIFFGCRHGLALILNMSRLHAVVWDPLTGHQRRVDFPPGFGNDVEENCVHNAAVLCASHEEGHVHGDCHSSPFKLVFVRTDRAGRVRSLASTNQSPTHGEMLSQQRLPLDMRLIS